MNDRSAFALLEKEGMNVNLCCFETTGPRRLLIETAHVSAQHCLLPKGRTISHEVAPIFVRLLCRTTPCWYKGSVASATRSFAELCTPSTSRAPKPWSVYTSRWRGTLLVSLLQTGRYDPTNVNSKRATGARPPSFEYHRSRDESVAQMSTTLYNRERCGRAMMHV